MELLEDSTGEEWTWVRTPAEGDAEWWGSTASDGDGPPRPLKVVFTAPAPYWTDSAPLGNGRLGAMVPGGVAKESLLLNHDTLWTGIPGDYTNPNSPSLLSEVRKLVDDGQYAEATLVAEGLSADPTNVYQPLGNINLEFDDSHVAYDSYGRELDLNTAMVTVTYSVGETKFTREHFCSNPHQVFVTKISANTLGSIYFTVSLDSKLSHHSRSNGASQIIMTGTCPGKRKPPTMNTTDDPKGIEFAMVLEVRISGSGGTIKVIEDEKLKVEGSDWAILLLAAASSFDGPFTKPSDSKRDPEKESLDALSSIKTISFSQLYAYHVDDYQNLFNRVALQLSKGSNNASSGEREYLPRKVYFQKSPLKAHKLQRPNQAAESSPLFLLDSTVSTAQRIESFKNDEDPALIELLFHYGRYLLISCSRPGTQVANLQGIWNKDLEPAWDAAPHLNINLQMNYWPSLSCNLSECQEPLFDYIASLAVNGSKTAKVNYEASGWVVHHDSDIWAKTSLEHGDPRWALWPMGGAWLCTHLWEHYSFTMDKEFLGSKAFPLLEGCASFLLDWLIEGCGGYLETNPSTSPEHTFIAPDGKIASVSYSTTMDMAIIREVFSGVINSAEILGKSDSEVVHKIKKTLPKLPPTKISREGTIMEWAQDFEDPEVHHRHLSHLFGLFPGHTITIQKTPNLCKASENSLYKRGDAGPGWSTTWKMALWARLHNNEHPYTLIKVLINLVDPEHEARFEGGLYSNLFTAHPPFQIDANFGFSAAIAEMLVQSTEHDLYLLPALPRDKWGKGYVRGLKARGGVTVSISWEEGELQTFMLCSKRDDHQRNLHYKDNIVTTRLLRHRIHLFNKDLKSLKTFPLATGQ